MYYCQYNVYTFKIRPASESEMTPESDGDKDDQNIICPKDV